MHRHLYQLIQDRNAASIQALFVDGEVLIEDQQAGPIHSASLDRWVKDTAVWLTSIDAQVWMVKTVETPDRISIEYEAWITTDDGRVDLPILTVADRTAEGLTTLRTYHSTWPWTGSHVARPPILAGSTADNLPRPIADYITAINTGDAGQALRLFADHGYMQEASGARFRHQGPALAKLYRHLDPGSDGPQLLARAVVADGHSAVVEYDFIFGDTTVAGAAAFQLTADGRIAAIRVCDDATL